MSPEIITSRFVGQTHCPICGKADAEHSFAERYECAKAEEVKRLAMVCPTCGKTIGEHSVEDHLACQKERLKGNG